MCKRINTLQLWLWHRSKASSAPPQSIIAILHPHGTSSPIPQTSHQILDAICSQLLSVVPILRDAKLKIFPFTGLFFSWVHIFSTGLFCKCNAFPKGIEPQRPLIVKHTAKRKYAIYVFCKILDYSKTLKIMQKLQLYSRVTGGMSASLGSETSLILVQEWENTYFLHIFNVGTCVLRLRQPSFDRKELWREKLQRLKDWRGGFGWRQVANGGFGRGAPSWPIIKHTATVPNYMIKPVQLPIHNTPLSLQGGPLLNMTTPKTDHNMVDISGVSLC